MLPETRLGIAGFTDIEGLVGATKMETNHIATTMASSRRGGQLAKKGGPSTRSLRSLAQGILPAGGSP